jgi:Protein tyrosine and serine/threonine kinase
MDVKFHVDPSNPLSKVKYLQPWHPPGIKEVLSGGSTARVGLLPDGSILKHVYDRDDRWALKGLDIEHHILTMLGDHERLVKYLGKHQYGLRFQFEVNGDVRRYLSRVESNTLPIQQREKWVRQAAESIAFIHSKHVIHCIQTTFFLTTGSTFDCATLLAPYLASWMERRWKVPHTSFQEIPFKHQM